MHNEALMHIATTTVGYPEGKTITLESVPPRQYEVTEDTETPIWNMVEGSHMLIPQKSHVYQPLELE